jgi:hypothetical protein
VNSSGSEGQGDRERRGTEESQCLDAPYPPGPSGWTLNVTVLEDEFRVASVSLASWHENHVSRTPAVEPACDVDRPSSRQGR